jgi:DnaK suppressor protein
VAVKNKPAAKAKPVGKAKPALKAKTSSVKAAPKAAAKAASKPSRPAAASKSPAKVPVAKSGLASAKAKTMPPAPVPPTPTAKANMLTPPPALKPGRRSSARATAHMPPPAPMVPTHAPDAAKASYSTITERVISPPPHVAAKKDPKLANNWKGKDAAALSDAEVKAMPDSEYMNEKQLAFFRHKLSVLKQEIHASAGQTTENLREDTVVVPDPADRATIEEEHALELRTRDRERKLLKKIEQSIGRIDAGDYGYCDETGEAIGVGRLIARPTASLSLEAQQRRELKQKMFGD